MLMNDPTISYHDVVDAFERQTKGKDLSNIKGSGKFQLYKNHFENKVNELGYYNEENAHKDRIKFFSKQKGKSIKKANWQYIGLENGNLRNMPGMWLGRVDRVAFHPTDEKIIWAGTPSGGLWKSEDGAESWSLISDTWLNLGIGDIIVDPNNPDNIYVATGDSDSWFFNSYGIQISRDGGKTWTLVNSGLRDVTQIYRLVLDEKEPNVLYCATEIGLFTSRDSGMTWNNMSNLDGRINDIEIHPGDNNILHVAVTKNNGWSLKGDKEQTKKQNFDFAYFRSEDRGKNFSQIDIGYETTMDESDDMLFGRIAVSPGDPEVVYIGGYANGGGSLSALYKSTDGGLSFIEKAPRSEFSGTIGAWTMHLATNPLNADKVIMGSVTARRSIDGGDTWQKVESPEQLLHVDIHDMKWQPGTDRLFIANDGGLEFENSIGELEYAQGIEVGQYYEISSSPHGEMIIGGLQDNGTRIKLPNGEWSFIVGGDGMGCLIDPVTERNFYASAQLGWTVKGSFTNERVDLWQNLLIFNEQEQVGTWETLIKIHPFKNNIIYVPLTDLFISEDFGDSFREIDLRALRLDNPIQIFEISESNPNVMYLSDGSTLAISEDGGESWTPVQRSFQISSLAIDDENPKKIWTAGRQINESTDGGKSFKSMAPIFPGRWKQHIVHQPGTKDGLYTIVNGTVAYIEDGMNSWVNYSSGLPNTNFNTADINLISTIGKMRISTWGRGIWESDLHSIDPDYLVRIPKPPTLNYTNCGNSLELSVKSDEAYDKVMWYRNDEFVESTTELTYLANESGSWGARLSNGPQNSYMSATVELVQGAQNIIGPDYVCEGSNQHYYILGSESESSIQWEVPSDWNSNIPSTSIGLEINSPSTLKAAQNTSCGIVNYEKEISTISDCSQIVLDFDGIDDYISIPSGLIDNVRDYTIETWFNLDHLPTTQEGGVDHYAICDFGADWNARVHLRVENNNLSFRVSNWENGWVGTIINSSKRVQEGRWYHVAVSYDSESRKAILFLDGINVGSAVMSREPRDLFSKSTLYIGRSLDYENNTYFSGKLDEFRFWTKARSEEEINEKMNCTLIGNEAGLALYYSFSDGAPNSDNINQIITTDYNFKTYNGQLLNFAKLGDVSNFIGVSDLPTSSSCFEIVECPSFSVRSTAQNVLCFGENNGRITMEDKSLTYQWSNGTNGHTISDLAAGKYHVTISNESGCMETASFDILEPNEISIEINLTIDSTTNAEALINGGTPPYEYFWSDTINQTSSTAMGLEAGGYTLLVTDQNGCQSSIEFQVSTTTSTVDETLLDQVKLYPNPANEILYIETEDDAKFESFMIVGLNGIIIAKGSLNESTSEIDISYLSTGVYYMRLSNLTNEVSIPFTKQ